MNFWLNFQVLAAIHLPCCLLMVGPGLVFPKVCDYNDQTDKRLFETLCFWTKPVCCGWGFQSAKTASHLAGFSYHQLIGLGSEWACYRPHWRSNSNGMNILKSPRFFKLQMPYAPIYHPRNLVIVVTASHVTCRHLPSSWCIPSLQRYTCLGRPGLSTWQTWP